MVFSYRELFFGGRTFCCCLPVRSGVIIMTSLGMLLSGILSIVLWYEVASTPDMSTGERAAFVITGLLETFLFVASVLGFVGAVVRKQVFVQIYTYFVYVHFFFNVALAGYLLWQVTHLTSEAADKACQDTISNAQAQDQCIGFLKIARGVYYVIATLVLLIELYGAIITTRYCNQLKSEKRMAKAGLFAGPEGYKMVPNAKYMRLSGHHSHNFSVSTPTSATLVGQSPYSQPRAFTPTGSSFAPSRSSYVPSGHTSYAASVKSFNPYDELEDEQPLAGSSSMPVPYESIEAGYGGGSWTHSDISAQEKARLRESMAAEDDDDDDDNYRPTSLYRDPFADVKASVVPPAPAGKSEDDLPRYTPSDAAYRKRIGRG